MKHGSFMTDVDVFRHHLPCSFFRKTSLINFELKVIIVLTVKNDRRSKMSHDRYHAKTKKEGTTQT